MRPLFTFLALLFLPMFQLQAGGPGEDVRKDTTLIKYLLSSDLTITSGNLNSIVTINRGSFEMEKKVYGIKTTAMYRYGFLDGTLNSNEFNSLISISLYPRKKLYAFLNGGLESSYLRGFNYRAFGGVGMTWRAINTEKQKLEPFLNLNYEQTQFRSPVLFNNDSTDLVQTLRGVLGWTGTHKVFADKLLITHGAKFQQSLQDPSNFRFDFNSSFSVPIFKFFSIKTGITYTYENIVLPERVNSDFVWTFGVILTNM